MEDIEKILKIVNNQLKYTKDINEKVNLIRQVRSIMNEVEQVTKEFYDDLNENYEYCDKCKKWYSKDQYKEETKTFLYKDTPLTYPDSNNINDIKFGDKIVDKTYLICPVCGDRKCIKTITTNYIFDGKDHKIGG